MLMIMEMIFGTNLQIPKGDEVEKYWNRTVPTQCNGMIYDHCDVDDDNFGDNDKNNKTITCAVHDNDDEKAAT